MLQELTGRNTGTLVAYRRIPSRSERRLTENAEDDLFRNGAVRRRHRTFLPRNSSFILPARFGSYPFRHAMSSNSVQRCALVLSCFDVDAHSWAVRLLLGPDVLARTVRRKDKSLRLNPARLHVRRAGNTFGADMTSSATPLNISGLKTRTSFARSAIGPFEVSVGMPSGDTLRRRRSV